MHFKKEYLKVNFPFGVLTPLVHVDGGQEYRADSTLGPEGKQSWAHSQAVDLAGYRLYIFTFE